MCDTLVKKTSQGLIFGKNSDRSPNEPNLIVYTPAHKSNNQHLHCTYITIDEVKSQQGVLLVQPSWLWGAEMGINDAGVMIGNEAVFTRSKGQKVEKLIGMDLLRLSLERADTAKKAVEVIIGLLEKYGQGGNCGFDKPFFYDNSFLVADKTTAFILETVGQKWVVKEVERFGNISNRLSLNNDFTMTSSKSNKRFAKKYSEPLFTFFSGSGSRKKAAKCGLDTPNEIDVPTMMATLRSHLEKDSKKLYTKGSVKSVCMHKNFLGDHTTGSMIVESRPEIDTIWLTGSSTPCLSIYKPTYFGVVVPPVFADKKSSLAYWLQREYLMRAIYAGLIDEKAYRLEAGTLQKRFIDEDKAISLSHPSVETLKAFAVRCSALEQDFVDKFAKEIDLVKSGKAVLPKMWAKEAKALGKNVFKITLKERTAE